MAVNLGMLVAQIVGMAVVFGLALFVPAGTIGWRAGWVYMALFFGFVVALSGWLVRSNPELMRERMTGVGAADQKTWDKVFLAVTAIAFFGWLALMPLDVVRYRWSSMPALLQVVGGAVLLGSFVLFFLTFRENSFLSPAVRIQEERGQTVVSSGPYGYVRHPMYAGFVLFVAGTALLLGSWWGLAAGLVLVALVAYRAVREEETLRAELPGYDAYMARTRYRLIPGVW